MAVGPLDKAGDKKRGAAGENAAKPEAGRKAYRALPATSCRTPDEHDLPHNWSCHRTLTNRAKFMNTSQRHRQRHRHLQHLASLLVAACLSIAGIGSAAAHEGTHGLAHQSGVATGGDFTLDSAAGPVTLKQFRGKVVVLYFGYTFCPDACPTTLAALGGAMKGMTPAEAAQIQPLFITLDPARDDAKRMAEYSRFFYPTMLGLIGSEAKVAAVARQYGVLFARQKVDSAANYVVDHSSFLYVVGTDGKLARSIPYGAVPLAIATALRAALPHSER
jgi:protein SCO1/2